MFIKRSSNQPRSQGFSLEGRRGGKKRRWENALMPTFRFRVDGKLCENGAFENVFRAKPTFSTFSGVLQTGPK